MLNIKLIMQIIRIYQRFILLENEKVIVSSIIFTFSTNLSQSFTTSFYILYPIDFRCKSMRCVYNIVMLRESNESSNTAIKQSTEQSRIQPTLPQVIYARDSNDRIEVGREGISAFPQNSKPFYKLAPFCLWDSFRQPHILYYVCCCVLEYFKFCSLRNGEIFGTSVLALLILFCMAFEVNARYSTYRQYSCFLPEQTLGSYRVWNRGENRWQQVQGSDLCVGQVVIVEKYLQSNNKPNPANLLPLAFPSGSKSMLLRTTRIDKREEYVKIKVVKPLRHMVAIKNGEIHINPELFTLSIQYRFISKLGSTFEAVLCFEQEPQEEVVISNSDIIPRGVQISTQDFVIGIVMRHTQSFQTSHADNSITKSNKINIILHRYLFVIMVLNAFLMVWIFVINLILTTVTTNFQPKNYGNYFYCFIINLAANLSNVVYIGMYILIYIHRAIDLRIMSKKYKLNFKNSIKSLDQLAQTDTLIMDDYFFIEKGFDIDEFKYIVNEDAPLNKNLNLILKIMEQSPLLKEHMLGHTSPISRYFRLQRLQCEKKAKIKILKQSYIDESTIQLTIKIIIRNKQSRYFVRFRDKPVSSTIQKIRGQQLRNDVNKLIFKGEENNALIFFVEIMQVQGTQLQISKSNQYMDFYAVFTFNETLNNNSLSLIRSESVLKKYNVVILTSRTWKYINYFMEKARMKASNDLIIALQQKQQKQMNHIIRNYRTVLKQAQKRKKANKKSAILFLNSSMITYLSRKNIRKSIFKLSVYCKYIIFYSCSQYQKQISAVNLFKIFPDHIFLSNYICDYDILQYSNLSICQRESSSQMLTTVVVNKYKNLQVVIFQQAIKSIQIIYCIINSCTFKNQLFLISHIIIFLFVYRGGIIELGISFVSEIYFFYNFVFTILPIFVMILRRPGLYIDEDVRQYLNVADMLVMNIKTIIFGAVTAYFTYNLLMEQFVMNVFTSILINCVITSNLFLLFLDDSYHKKWQVVSIIIQIIISITLIVMIQLYDAQNFQFVQIGTNFDTNNIWFYFTTFLIIPVISILVIFAFSAGREIKVIQNSREMVLKQWSQRVQSGGESNEQQNYTQMVLKVPKSKGKQLSFQQEDFRLLD